MSDYLQLPDEQALAQASPDVLAGWLGQCVTRSWQQGVSVWPGVTCPPWWLDLRGRSAGQAHFGRGGLRFNRVLLKENPALFLFDVVPHEMAHWFVHAVHEQDGQRVAPHGRQWKRMMQDVFLREPRVTHHFDTTRASPTPYRFTCRCSSHYLSRRRYLNTQRGGRYRCRLCQSPLVFAGSRV
ncbi:SprT family zinc-dependent metalloprotease [Larsenimonas rhizosphaerae]|uniref:SprT-like domain-containing protein n=1 Tax=Larsenimonas rhizosphaerae TaxID=2944682 RepID=A0AA41ZE11_9GAMM|nr:SprT-like domain-containing protein [Larsenimonas rhizosphaerae]MCX2522826.1 SprT-like domain-containing protein [Larsenimonas rhizosphaerae]